ncbi:FHA domain-containing protein [Alteromonadaceae bacterium 2753L.S.0a.02]|nr:FHA domain-containing protein [Alteromonadaceae bacterium 2753L.S.0a.02]
MLKVRYKNLQRDPFWVMERNFAIGRAEDNNLNLDHPSVADHHARISRERDVITLRDLGSENGSYVNGQRVSVQPISCGDILRIGEVELEIIDPIAETQGADQVYWSLIGNSSWLAGQEFPLCFTEKQTLLLGRGKHCDIVFPGTHLSREHARIVQLNAQELQIDDLKSANATFVNDTKVAHAKVRAGDHIRFDVYSFCLFGPGIQLHKSATRRPPAVSPAERKAARKKTSSAGSAAKPSAKRWKTAPTSPGNREETQSGKTPVTHWILAVLLLILLILVIARVL